MLAEKVIKGAKVHFMKKRYGNNIEVVAYIHKGRNVYRIDVSNPRKTGFASYGYVNDSIMTALYSPYIEIAPLFKGSDPV